MNTFILFGFVVSILNVVSCNSNSLEFVFAVFRHGDKTNEKTRIYESYPFANETYFPIGRGLLTNKGKNTAFNLGKRLRLLYKNFLNEYYFPSDVYAVATDTERTKMTLELVLAKLYPPRKTINQWHYGLNWQPIPFDVIPHGDNVASFPYANCPKFVELYQKYYSSVFGTSLREKYAKLIQAMETFTGIKNVTYIHLCFLYTSFQADKEWGLKLPPWIDHNLENLQNAYIDFYNFTVNIPKLNKLSGGFLLQKITDALKQKIETNSTQQIYLLSAHDNTILYLMGILGVYYKHIPNYCACFLIELHKVKGVYGVKIFYLHTVGAKPKPMLIPKCGHFCEFEKFVRLYEKSISIKPNACNVKQY
ncbi:hypothetical protein RN001_004361 [Aquatica leii]|uniref:acid phosphatase n=1 Tax=Aquatica leii TaxID=1421715 RepID=A0AAN7SHF7_9COLE|nr:hypothetical protein RN001_004361 [Aquatica leii]